MSFLKNHYSVDCAIRLMTQANDTERTTVAFQLFCEFSLLNLQTISIQTIDICHCIYVNDSNHQKQFVILKKHPQAIIDHKISYAHTHHSQYFPGLRNLSSSRTRQTQHIWV